MYCFFLIILHFLVICCGIDDHVQYIINSWHLLNTCMLHSFGFMILQRDYYFQDFTHVNTETQRREVTWPWIINFSGADSIEDERNIPVSKIRFLIGLYSSFFVCL